MAKGSKKGNGGKKKSNQKKEKHPKTADAKKLKSVNEMPESSNLSWTSEEKDDDSIASLNDRLYARDMGNISATNSQFQSWIESVRAPLRTGGNGMVTPSPLLMQQLQPSSGNTNPNWRSSLFENVRVEGLNLEIEKNVENNENNAECVKITLEDIQPEIEY